MSDELLLPSTVNKPQLIECSTQRWRLATVMQHPASQEGAVGRIPTIRAVERMAMALGITPGNRID